MAVELHNVSKQYRIHRERARSFHELIAEGFRPWRQRSQEDVWALQDISMVVPQGETLGIIGPNGAGKSTILKLIARVLEQKWPVVEVTNKPIEETAQDPGADQMIRSKCGVSLCPKK